MISLSVVSLTIIGFGGIGRKRVSHRVGTKPVSVRPEVILHAVWVEWMPRAERIAGGIGIELVAAKLRRQ
jgi:hypothetical protein